MAMPGIRPQIVLLREGTDTSQGKGQILSNINAWWVSVFRCECQFTLLARVPPAC
jgi:hypothetical protein